MLYLETTPAARLLAALLSSACMACASVSETTPPGLQVLKDDYDGATIVRQAPVNSGSDAAGDWNALGFEWKSKFPNRVVIAAGTRGVINITDLVLEIDGENAAVKRASELTDYGDSSTGERWSMRRFEVSWADFERMATAHAVQVRVIGANEIFVTSFGADRPGAPVNTTLPAFRAEVRKQRGEEP
ncbi:MAG TPA: hypothetical protein VMG60_01230 [Burkholderiaceae bacterium]|nr:hypothetical protein [Burkholderiaceae bacterium]